MSPDPVLEPSITYSTYNKYAIITLNRPSKLNALTQDDYYLLATNLLRSASDPSIYITILTGKGRFFSAGADFSLSRSSTDSSFSSSSSDPNTHTTRSEHLRSFAANNLNLTHAFYTHPKILVSALNGPVIGLSAALIAWSDFIYASPTTYLLTPFSSLGLVTEGGASIGFVQRMGISKANEALIMSKKISVEELVSVWFVHKVFDTRGDKGLISTSTTDPPERGFLGLVMHELDERLGEHLNQGSLLKTKELIRAPTKREMDAQGVAEVMSGLERFAAGVPQREFDRLANGEKKHKL